MLDEGSGVVGTKREIAAEANVGSDDCAERESNELVFRLCIVGVAFGLPAEC